jgi:hypothetical protein
MKLDLAVWSEVETRDPRGDAASEMTETTAQLRV